LEGSSSHNATIFCSGEVLSLDWDVKSDKLLLCGTSNRSIKLFSTEKEKVICDLYSEMEYPRIVDLSFSPTSTMFVCSAASQDRRGEGTLLPWNLKTSKVEHAFPVEPDPVKINSIRFNHNGSMLLTGGIDGMIRIFDMSNFSTIMGWKAHECPIASISFNYDETRVFSIGVDGKFYSWSIQKVGKYDENFELKDFLVKDDLDYGGEVAFDGPGRHFITSSPYREVLLYKVGEAKVQQRINCGHTGEIISVDWHPAQNTIVTGSTDHSIRVSRLTPFV